MTDSLITDPSKQILRQKSFFTAQDDNVFLLKVTATAAIKDDMALPGWQKKSTLCPAELSDKKVHFFPGKQRLAFAELESAASTALTVLLALNHAAITCKISVCME